MFRETRYNPRSSSVSLMEDHRPRWGGWTSNPDGIASDPRQVRLL